MRLDGAMCDLAERQHGVLATWQAMQLGLRRQELHRLRWVRPTPRVLVRPGAPRTDRQGLLIGVLDAGPGAAIASTSAAWLWGARGFRPRPMHVVRPAGASRRPSTLAEVHEVHDLLPHHIKVVDAIPVVSPSRVVCELCATHPHRAARVLDDFWSDRLLDGRTFRRTVEELRDRGRTGSTLFRELDAERGPDYVPPASGLERRFMEICPWPMRRQVDRGDEEWCGRVDFVATDHRVVAEIQSERFHSSLVDKAADAARKARLEAAGITVVEIWDHEVWHTPGVAIERLRQARQRAA